MNIPEWFLLAYVTVCALVSMLGLMLSGYAFSQAQVKGGRMMGWAMFAASLWAAMTVLYMILPSETQAIRLDILRSAGAAVFAVCFFGFALEYADVRPRTALMGVLILLLVPLGVFSAALTQPGFFVADIAYQTAGFVRYSLSYTRGPGFYIHLYYSYFVVAAGLTLLTVVALRAPRLYRRQVLTILAGVLLPLGVDVITTLILVSSAGVDWTVPLLLFTGVMWSWAVFRRQIFAVTPIAYESIVRGLDEAVFVLDLEDKLVDLNPAAEALIGRAGPGLLGQPIDVVLAQDPPDFIARYRHAARAQAEVSMGQPTRHFELQISTLRSGQQPAGRLVLLRDITARKQAELEREEMITDLKAYAHTVAHDLKNPLNALINGAVLLRLLVQDEQFDQVHEVASTIESSGYRMNGIIEELLLLAEIREMPEVPLAPVDMGQVLPTVERRLSNLIRARGAHIEQPEEWPLATGYDLWVREIWYNLMNNALRSEVEGPTLTLGWDPQGAMLRFTLRDSLAHPSPEQLEALYKTVTRLDHRRGQGLGLSVVRRAVERLGGEVGVLSMPERGSLFWFTLPRHPGASPASEPEAIRV